MQCCVHLSKCFVEITLLPNITWVAGPRRHSWSAWPFSPLGWRCYGGWLALRSLSAGKTGASIMPSEESPLASEFALSASDCILLAGPTAVGKSEVALLLAQKVGGEIISVDSMQVY